MKVKKKIVSKIKTKLQSGYERIGSNESLIRGIKEM